MLSTHVLIAILHDKLVGWIISQFTSAIHHIRGSQNVVADALSRLEMNAALSGQPLIVDNAAMAQAQVTDTQIRALQSSLPSPLVVEAIPLPTTDLPLLCDISTGTQRPLVPLQWR